MPLIQQTGRKTTRARAAYAIIYVCLGLGALSILYPLALMLRRSVSSYVEVNEKGVIPRYLYNDTQLFQKYLALKYHHRFISEFNNWFATDFDAYTDIALPEINEPLVDQWLTFTSTVPPSAKQALFTDFQSRKLPGRTHIFFQRYVLEKYGSVDGIRKAYRYPFLGSIRGMHVPKEALADRWFPFPEPRLNDWTDFKTGLSEEYLTCPRTEIKWAGFLRGRYQDKLDVCNRENGTAASSFRDIPLPLSLPDRPAAAAAWEEFVRDHLSYRFIRFAAEAVQSYRDFLKMKYKGDIAWYNRVHGSAHEDFNTVELPENLLETGMDLHEMTGFMRHIPAAQLLVSSTENSFRQYLLGRMGSLEKINTALGTAYKNLTEIKPPWLQTDRMYLEEAKGYWRKHFLLRNYAEVFDHIFFNGRILKTTVLYLLGVILLQLFVNTLAAYALSRFRLAYGYKILLFFLVTMAFPAEITMIPNFILMQQLHILNTFKALILPTAVNAYFIFVLKGFFDNLPRYCYEAAELDDVNELSIFWNITLPMSKPAIAWLVLQSFSLAYSSFLFIMIVAQQKQMWTLMVFIYEMQNWAPSFLIMAAITVAAVPGIIVFLVCQRFIMRGMGLPLEH